MTSFEICLIFNKLGAVLNLLTNLWFKEALAIKTSCLSLNFGLKASKNFRNFNIYRLHHLK